MAEATSRREHERKSVLVGAEVSAEGKTYVCDVIDISTGGAKIKIEQDLPTQTEVELKFDPYGTFPAVIRWSNDGFHGLKFSGDRDELAEHLMAMATYG
ncbi:MAG: PilZ domain-containing protein [Rhodospirillales bacterium]|jgi:hypothetical protein|nr:PilZ domain-containing protein [Rhodospirillales bacterium]